MTTADADPSALTVDDVLRTTRSVRRRLDLERNVDLAMVDECIQIALQAPTGSNAQAWHFVTVTPPCSMGPRRSEGPSPWATRVLRRW